MYYRLVSDASNRLTRGIKIFLLMLGILTDIGVIFSLVFALVGAHIYWAAFAVCLSLSIVLRVFAVNLTYKVECKLQNGQLIISKLYPHKNKVIFKENLGDFEAFAIADDSQRDKIVQDIANRQGKQPNIINLLCENSQKYVFFAEDKLVICNADNYIYATSLKGEEI